MRLAQPLSIAALALLSGACVTTAASSQGEALFVRRAMQTQVNPAIVGMWSVTNNAMNDVGGLDERKMTPEMWDLLALSAGDLASAAEAMAAAPQIHAASPGNMATEDYEVSMADVQDFIDADPAGFRAEAARFAAMSRSLQAAATERNVAAASPLVAGMDSECAACHSRYWYAEG